MSQFWGNFTGSWSQTGTSGAQQQGVTFQLTAALSITGIGFYRAATGSGWKPDTLMLWRVSDTAKLVDLSSLNDDGAVGWQWTALPTPITLQANVLYRVTSYSATARTIAYISANGPDTVPTPFSKPASVGTYGNTAGFPDNSSASLAWGADVTDDTSVQPGSGGTGPAPDPGEATLHGIQQWLQSGYPGLRADSLAKMAVDHLVYMRGVLDDVESYTDDLPPLLQVLTTTYLNNLRADIDNLLTYAGSTNAKVQSALSNDPVSGGTLTGNALTDLYNALSTQIASTQNVSLLREWLTLSPDLDDPSRWTVQGSVTVSGDGFVPYGADLYRVTLDNIPPNSPAHNLGGNAIWAPRIAWCSPQRNGLNGWRHYLEFGANLVHDRGIYMGGLNVYAHPGVTWTADALTLDR